MRFLPSWLPLLGLGLVATQLPAAVPSVPLAFRTHADGGFEFDTGVIRGRLRMEGKSLGLQQVVHGPSGRRLDRSNGLLGHYRVFAGGRRHGGGAWDWPSRAVRLEDGSVRVVWPSAQGRPFELRATYSLPDAGSVEVRTEVQAREDLAAPEVFVASYFDVAFDTARVAVAEGGGGWRWAAATRDRGEWQIHPRDAGAVSWIRDGRWALEPNPVAWELKEDFGPWAMAVREIRGDGLAAGMVSGRGDCFAVALPYQEEGHCSLYHSLFGGAVRAGETAEARTRWMVAGSVEAFAGRAAAFAAGGEAVVGQGAAGAAGGGGGSLIVPESDPVVYPDGRPSARYRLQARDAGVVLRHGSGPGGCDALGARDVWVWEDGGRFLMHYDGAGPRGWLACLAVSTNLTHWEPRGPILDFGAAGQPDSASASYGVTFREGAVWHLFYLGTPNATPSPDFVPGFPYLTLKAHGASPAGPWTKQRAVIPFTTKPGTYYSVTASPGHIVRDGGEYLMFFSAASDGPVLRTLGLARTRDLDGAWTLPQDPILPPAEQVENASLYHDEARGIWFLFTNHVGLEGGLEYTDALWVYWTRDLRRWNARDKAVVLDGRNCGWSRRILGLPSVVRHGDRLAVFYDGYGGAGMPPGVKSHMNRDVGLAWLDLPIRVP